MTPDGTLWWLGERGGEGPTSSSLVLWQDKGFGAKSFLDFSADLTSGTELGGMALRVDPTGARVAIPAEEKGGGNDHVLLVRDLPKKAWTRFAMEATPVLWLDASRLLALGKEENDAAPLLLLNVESRTTRTLCDRVSMGLTVFAEPGGKSVLVTTVAPPPDPPKSVGLSEPAKWPRLRPNPRDSSACGPTARTWWTAWRGCGTCAKPNGSRDTPERAS